jgi:hypothetical protein
MTPNASVQEELNSTTLARASYQADSAVLQLQFRDGSIYLYRNVPEWLHHALQRADSPGAYFNLRIRGRFPYLQVRPAR